jgi:hypothetical protein
MKQCPQAGHLPASFAGNGPWRDRPPPLCGRQAQSSRLRHKRRKARANLRGSKYKNACAAERDETTKKFVLDGVEKVGPGAAAPARARRSRAWATIK